MANTNGTDTSHELSAMLEDVRPMLATLVSKPLEEVGWLYEIKWDGFRALAYVQEDTVQLRSRNNKSFNEKFYPVFKALTNWNVNVVADGEIIVINESGMPDFAALQTWRSEADGQLIYYLFDILWHNGKDLMPVPLAERRKILESLVPSEGIIKVSEQFDIAGKEFFHQAEKMGLEGIVAKKADSVYVPDFRSKDWVKIKTIKQQEAVIAGYTRNENSSRKISALLLGMYYGNEFRFIGSVGTGFTAKMQEEIIRKLKPLQVPSCPFREVPEYNKPSRFRPDPPKAEVVWVQPELVAEINYKTVAPDGTFRHPAFKGLREDKHAKQVVPEIPVAAESLKEKTALSENKAFARQEKQERATLLNPVNESQVRIVQGNSLKFGNLSKVYWPEDRITKRDMLNYYYQVAPYMLPYVKDRPQTLNRFPNGIDKQSFYQKDVTGKIPDWISTHVYHSDADEKEKHFLVINEEASLLYVASLGCIEINPWSSTTQHPDHPDWCIIDLDPDKNTFNQVIEAAQVTRQILNTVNVPSYCKTSGSTGLHLYIPLAAEYTYEDSKEFGRTLMKIVNRELPAYTSIERIISNRDGKMYLDFLQNRPRATVAAPYSLRPKPGATVSMPLYWEEVKKGLSMKDFHIRNAMDRLKETGDIFKPVLGKGVDIVSAKKDLENLY